MLLWPMLWCKKSSLCEKSFLRPSFWEKSFWNRNFTWNIFFPKVILRDSALTNYILWLTHHFAPANPYKDFVCIPSWILVLCLFNYVCTKVQMTLFSSYVTWFQISFVIKQFEKSRNIKLKLIHNINWGFTNHTQPWFSTFLNIVEVFAYNSGTKEPVFVKNVRYFSADNSDIW